MVKLFFHLDKNIFGRVWDLLEMKKFWMRINCPRPHCGLLKVSKVHFIKRSKAQKGILFCYFFHQYPTIERVLASLRMGAWDFAYEWVFIKKYIPSKKLKNELIRVLWKSIFLKIFQFLGKALKKPTPNFGSMSKKN